MAHLIKPCTMTESSKSRTPVLPAFTRSIYLNREKPGKLWTSPESTASGQNGKNRESILSVHWGKHG